MMVGNAQIKIGRSHMSGQMIHMNNGSNTVTLDHVSDVIEIRVTNACLGYFGRNLWYYLLERRGVVTD